jgi:hypothetical protein
MDLTSEEERRWDRAWEEATEFERRRFDSLHPAIKLGVLFLVPAGEAESLREAIALATEEFEEFMDREG